MSIVTIPGTEFVYYLISFDKHGRERSDDPDADDGLLSKVVVDLLKKKSVTDVFFISHGWKGDVPAAISQYNAWIEAMTKCSDDRQKIRDVRPGFKPLIVGLHWPSLPWGDEDQSSSAFAFDTPGDQSLDQLIQDAADKIADSERAKQALRTIFDAALEDIEPVALPDEVVDAYQILIEEAQLESDGPGAEPGRDTEPFDPENAYQDARADEAISFGGSMFGGLLSPLRQLSFWSMKKRARIFGESGACDLLCRMQQCADNQRDVKFHMMGHSFGCIVISSTVQGNGSPHLKPVDSIFLVQGALSLWSYCSDIPVTPGQAGYFHNIFNKLKIRGPLLTTQSEFDTAVGKLYPLAAGIRGQIDMAPGDIPKYGAIGTYGIQGPGIDIEDMKLRSIDEQYEFAPGRVYNLDCSTVITDGEGLSGAHNDIARAEVAHAFWQAVIAAAGNNNLTNGNET